MPKMKITTVDGNEIEVNGSPALQIEIDRYQAAIDALLPDLDGSDDVAGERAMVRYNLLATRVNRIVEHLGDWNRLLAEENRNKRKALAASIRERRRHG